MLIFSFLAIDDVLRAPLALLAYVLLLSVLSSFGPPLVYFPLVSFLPIFEVFHVSFLPIFEFIRFSFIARFYVLQAPFVLLVYVLLLSLLSTFDFPLLQLVYALRAPFLLLFFALLSFISTFEVPVLQLVYVLLFSARP